MRRIAAIAVLGGLSFVTRHASSQAMRIFSSTRAAGNEKMLTANVDFGSGSLLIQPNQHAMLYSANLRYDTDRFVPTHQFDPVSGSVKLGLSSVGGTGIKVTSRAQLKQTAVFEFSPDIPLALTANVGSSEAVLNLGGLSLRNLTVRSGASHTIVTFSSPTKGTCTTAAFSVAATDLDIRNLAQSGCSRVTIEGGMGAVQVDFGGVWRSNTRLTVDLTMGALTLVIPKGTGVRIEAQRFLSPIESQGFTRTGNVWMTPGFESAGRQLQVQLKTTLAGVDVKWRD